MVMAPSQVSRDVMKDPLNLDANQTALTLGMGSSAQTNPQSALRCVATVSSLTMRSARMEILWTGMGVTVHVSSRMDGLTPTHELMATI